MNRSRSWVRFGLACALAGLAGAQQLSGPRSADGKSAAIDIPRDDNAFLAFLSQVLFLLERPEPPDPDPKCGFCSYLSNGALFVLTGLFRE